MPRRHWGEFEGRHRHFGRRGLRHGRPFDHGDLRYIILKLIAEKPRHGYEIIKAIEAQLGGMYSPSPGVVYPTLTLLEELGYVAVTPVGSKKQYAITAEGSAFLEHNRAVADAVFARLAEASRAYGRGPAPEILRAVHNLRLALCVRLGKGPLTEAQIVAITAALDRAASDIERS
jgi:DNA-binding PadR family transcriptional regulator